MDREGKSRVVHSCAGRRYTWGGPRSIVVSSVGGPSRSVTAQGRGGRAGLLLGSSRTGDRSQLSLASSTTSASRPGPPSTGGQAGETGAPPFDPGVAPPPPVQTRCRTTRGRSPVRGGHQGEGVTYCLSGDGPSLFPVVGRRGGRASGARVSRKGLGIHSPQGADEAVALMVDGQRSIHKLGDGPVLSRSVQPRAVWQRNGGVGRGAGTRDLGGLGRQGPPSIIQCSNRAGDTAQKRRRFQSHGRGSVYSNVRAPGTRAGPTRSQTWATRAKVVPSLLVLIVSTK